MANAILRDGINHKGLTALGGLEPGAGEYVMVHSDVLVPPTPRVHTMGRCEVFNVEQLPFVGETVSIGSIDESGESIARLDVDEPGPPISTFSSPGRYGLVYVPFEE